MAKPFAGSTNFFDLRGASLSRVAIAAASAAKVNFAQSQLGRITIFYIVSESPTVKAAIISVRRATVPLMADSVAARALIGAGLAVLFHVANVKAFGALILIAVPGQMVVVIAKVTLFL